MPLVEHGAMSTSAAHPSPALRRSSPGAGRVVALIAGSLLALLAAALILGGAALLAAHLTQRDDDGFYTSPTTRLATGTYALTGEGIDLGDAGRPADLVGRVLRRDDARPRRPGRRRAAVRRYRARGRGADVPPWRRPRPGAGRRSSSRRSQRPRTTACPAAAPRSRRDQQRIWVASSSGAGTQTLQWKPRSGRWSVVVMRADAARGVAADVNVGVRLNVLLWIGIGLLAAGVLIAGASAGSLVFGTRSGGAARPVPPRPAMPWRGRRRRRRRGAPAYPVDIRAKLDEPLSRWLWIVKWFLAIPHLDRARVPVARIRACSPWSRSSRS